jgi:hypothetical protein
MAQRDATPAQERKLKAIRKEFPSMRKRGYRVDPVSGLMTVTMETEYHKTVLVFGTDGERLSAHTEATLDAPPAVTADPTTHTHGTLREPREPTDESCGKVGHEPNCICHRY